MDIFLSLLLFSSIVSVCWCDCSPRVDLPSKNDYTSLYNLTASYGKWPSRVLKGSKNTVRASGRLHLKYTIDTLSAGNDPLAPQGNDILVEKMCIRTQNIKQIDGSFQGPILPATKTPQGGIRGKGPGLSFQQIDVTNPGQWTKSCFKTGVFSKIELTLKPDDDHSMIKAKALFIKGCPKSRV